MKDFLFQDIRKNMKNGYTVIEYLNKYINYEKNTYWSDKLL